MLLARKSVAVLLRPDLLFHSDDSPLPLTAAIDSSGEAKRPTDIVAIWGEEIHFIGGNGPNPSEIAICPPHRQHGVVGWGEEIHFIGGNYRDPSEIAAFEDLGRTSSGGGVDEDTTPENRV